MTTRRWCSMMIALGLGLGGVPAAFADPVAELQASSNLYLDSLRFTLAGDHEVDSSCLTKTSGSFDLDLNVRALGIDADISVHLSGSVAGNVLTWTFDQTLSPPQPTGAPGVSVDRVHGQLTVGIRAATGYETRTCGGVDRQYDVELSDVPGSDVEAHIVGPFGIDLGTQVASNIHVAGVAGLGPATLSDLRVDAPPGACARATRRSFSGVVTLAGQAHPGGSLVHLMSSDPTHVRALDVLIPAGSWSAAFSIFVAPGWDGTATLTASTDDGAVVMRQIVVAPQTDCVSVGPVRFRVPLVMCAACTAHALNNHGDLLYVDSGKLFVRHLDGSLDALQDQLADLTSVSVASFGPGGQVLGSGVRADGVTVGFVTALPGTADPRRAWAGSFPSAINNAGLAVGAIVGPDKTESAALFTGTTVVPFAVGGSSSIAAGLNDLGAIAGITSDTRSARAFLYRDEKLQILPDLGGGQTYVTALGNGDDVIGDGQRKDGNWHAFRFTAGDSAPRDLGVLAGYTTSAAASVNSSGHVVGSVSGATSGKSVATRGFYFSDQAGLVDLNKAVDPDAGAVITDALAINDLDQVLVHGTINGKDAYFLLAPGKP